MESDIERKTIIGIIDHPLKFDGARIKGIGYINSANQLELIPESDITTVFPPKGFIFGHKFFKDSKLDVGDLIEFTIVDAQNQNDHGDLYKINTDSRRKPRLWGHRIFEVENFNISDNFVDLSNVPMPLINYPPVFYILNKNRIYGKLKFQNSIIQSAESAHFLFEWDSDQCEVYKTNKAQYLLTEPTKEHCCNLVDVLDKNGLFFWFKAMLKKLDSDFSDIFIKNTSWRTEMIEIFTNQDQHKTIVEKNRLQRIIKNLDQFELVIDEIKQLSQLSENFHNSFVSLIEKHKAELQSEYASDIEVLRNDTKYEELKLNEHLSRISLDIARKEKELIDLDIEITSKSNQISHIEENKLRILSDFSIVREVLGVSLNGNITPGPKEDSFVFESISPGAGENMIIQKDVFISRLKYSLNQRNLDFLQSVRLVSILSSFKGVFLRDIELGLAFIEATGNSKYIIQQVEPDWLHFNDLWKNGLGTIWESSHENPEILHFFVLEDINLSSPECYMRPLLDCMNGIRKAIPFAKTKFPPNLKVLATRISSDEPKIGLPLFQQTFKNWGAIGFNADDITNQTEQSHIKVDGYLNIESFYSFKLDDFDLKTDSLGLTYEYDKLFDNVE